MSQSNIQFLWKPGHTNIPGNNKTDAHAKTVSALQNVADLAWELTSCAAMTKVSLLQSWQNIWNNTNITNKYEPHIANWSTSYGTFQHEEVVIAHP